MSRLQAPNARRLPSRTFLLVIPTLFALACDPRMILKAEPTKICGCADIDVTWDTNATSPRLSLLPDVIPPESGAVDLRGSRTINVCGPMRISLTGIRRGRELTKTVRVESGASMEVRMDLGFQAICSGRRFSEWTVESGPPSDFVRNMTVSVVFIHGPDVYLRHNSGSETEVSGGSDFFAGDDPSGVWHARPTLGLGECPGEPSPIPGDPPPSMTVVLRCPSP